jgi:putative transcriptional regulator
MELAFVEKLKIWRERRGLSQAELAKKADVSRNSISMLERGEYNPSLDQLNKITHALELELQMEVKPYVEFKDGNIDLCEVCGEPARYGLQDTIWFNDLTKNMVVTKPRGNMHWLCEQHKRKSESIYGGEIYK